MGTSLQRVVPEPLSEGSTVPNSSWVFLCKAVVDFVVVLFLLALAVPVIAVAAVLVKLTSRGPAFYSQSRLGKGSREFRLYKLRTMVHNAETSTGPIWAESDDPRVTPLGRFLRSTHVDELPQLVNVLLGHMSLVGPRPERPEMVAKLQRELPQYQDRLKIRPGMTGLAQLRLPPDSDLESVRQKLAYDFYYVRHAHPWLDLRILFFTCVRLVIRVSKTFWKPFALPHWETVNGHVPVVVGTDLNCDAPVEAQSADADWEQLTADVSQPHADPERTV